MYDLSWLNPTPHAIAVYASQPLSPVATQHSLPSGRYSLLGPDFHRQDRTSFVLAHLFDHLVGGRGGLAILRAQSMKTSARALRVLPRKVMIPIGRRTDGPTRRNRSARCAASIP